MTRIVVEGEVPKPIPRTLETFWSLEALRESWPFIIDLEVHYRDAEHQEVSMSVDRDGTVERIRVVRFLRGQNIEFFNPEPPPAMTYHRGAWRVAAAPGGRTLVRIEREYELRRRPGEGDAAHEERCEAFRASFRRRLEAILSSIEGDAV